MARFGCCLCLLVIVGAAAVHGQVDINPWDLPSEIAATAPAGLLIPNGATYAPKNVNCGGTVAWTWTDFHGLYRIPSATCPTTFQNNTNGQVEISPAVQGGQATVAFNKAGRYWFACPVPGHCPAGVKILITATNPTACPSTTTPEGFTFVVK